MKKNNIINLSTFFLKYILGQGQSWPCLFLFPFLSYGFCAVNLALHTFPAAWEMSLSMAT